MGNQDPEIAKL